MILINVTAFFRDEPAWEFLREQIVPGMLDGARNHDPLRIWSAGCASGEEAYSLAMLLAEALGREQFRDRIKIYATDVDEQALNQARAASYSEKDLEAVPEPLRRKYFAQESDRYLFDKDLRRSVIFGRHDLIQDAPISRISLLVCRNSLMYFNSDAQSRILARFHFALGENGVLFLGKAEMLLSHTQLFAPIDLRQRIFRKVAKDNWRERMAIMSHASGDDSLAGEFGRESLYPAAFNLGPNAQVVVDSNGLLAFFNERARMLFALAPSDVGRPIQDLEMSYRPLELRSLMTERSSSDGRSRCAKCNGMHRAGRRNFSTSTLSRSSMAAAVRSASA